MSAFPKFDPWAETAIPEGGAAKVAKVAKECGGNGKTLATFAGLAGGTGENPIPKRDAVGQTAPTNDPVIWHDWIAERAAILEHDAAKPRAGADQLAYEAALARWQNEHSPARADQDHCAACGGWLLDDLLPLAERDVHGRPVWVHAGCWREYVRKRRAEAETAVCR